MMHIYIFLSFFIPILAFDNHIWPRPHSVHLGKETTVLLPSFDITISAKHDIKTLKHAADRAKSYLWNDNVPELVPFFTATANTSSSLKSLHVIVKKGTNVPFSSQKVTDIDESYELIIPSGNNAHAKILANSTAGALHGLTSFTQIWTKEGGRPATLNLHVHKSSSKGKIYARGVPMHVIDLPALPHRGLLMDTSRHYFPISDLKRTLDTMSWTKLNVLHWHITDAQSWPLQVIGFENVSKSGAYVPEWVYTKQNIDDLTQYASDRGIHILIEIDSPGHTAAISYSHPDLIACMAHQPWTDDANEPPSGQLRIGHPPAIKFLKNYFNSLLPSLKNPFFHTGGDEVNIPCYTKDPIVSAAAKKRGNGNVNKGVELLLADWVQGLHKVVHHHKKTPIVWEEMLLNHHTGISKDTWVQVWTSAENIKKVAKKGYNIIVGSADFMYLDCGHGDFLGKNPTGNSWCDPYKTWQMIYTFDPYQSLNSKEKKYIKGGETLMWTEQTNSNNLDRMVWPRAASAGEVYWSFVGGANNVTRINALPDALKRLNMWGLRANSRGVNAEPLQPTWCITRPGQCDLP